METNRIQDLLEKHIAFGCNQSEQEELAKLIESISDDLLKPELLKLLEQYKPIIHIPKSEKEQKLREILNSGEPTIKSHRKLKNYYKTVAAVAASVIILFSLGLFTQKLNNHNNERAMVIKAPTVSPDRSTSYIRHLTLPDGTSVILKAGSTLHFPNQFAEKTREVTLKGEAYFDVKHMNSKPFIIHTGTVKTTVLGTAFDIKAWPDQKNVIVSVTRGKVRVEDNNRVLAVLTVNQSVDYNLRNTDAKQQTVNAEETVSNWTKQDMVFERASFESIVQVLSKRYGTDITISNSQLASTQITSSFSGTESLENILETLCIINTNTQYTIESGEVIITNKN